MNSALLGALARAVGDPPLPVLERMLLESPKLQAENVAACTEGYEAVECPIQRGPHEAKR